MHRRFLFPVAAFGLCFFAAASPARALVVAPPPGAARAAQADVIVTGKVTMIEDQPIQLEPFPGSPQKVNHKIAVITVDEAIRGVKGQKTIRVAFQSFDAVPNPNPNPKLPIRPLPGRPRPGVVLQKDTDGLFYLSRTGTDGVYRTANYYDVVARNNPQFAKDVAEAKEVGVILANPMAALKDPMREKRVNAAVLLVTMYRTQRGGQVKAEPIDAEESKLIMSALATADWSQPVRFGANHPMNAFNMLGVGPNEGWTPPQVIRNPQDLSNAMQQWLANNAATYRIQRFVPAAAPDR